MDLRVPGERGRRPCPHLDERKRDHLRVPEAFYDQTRPVIFATASTKVYGRSYYGEK